MRDGSQFTGMLFHPRIDGGSRSTAPSNRSNSVLIISLLSAFESCGYVTEGLPVNRLLPDFL